MKFNFFVLILCVMIHFIAQATIGDSSHEEVKGQRGVASGKTE